MPHSRGWERRRDPRTREPALIGEVVEGLLRDPEFARGIPVGRLAARWADVVGERLAREIAPTHLERGILTVAASDAVWGAQAKFLVDEIRRKASEVLGSGIIHEVRIVIVWEARHRR